MKRRSKKYFEQHAEHIKLKWFHKLKILKPKLRRVKVKTNYIKHDIKNNRKTKKYFILLLLIFLIGTSSIATTIVYVAVGNTEKKYKIVDLDNFEKRVGAFSNQTYAREETFLNCFKKEFESDQSIKELEISQVKETNTLEISKAKVDYEVTFKLNQSYKWSDKTTESKTFFVSVLYDSRLLIDSDEVFDAIRSELNNDYFNTSNDVINKISLIELSTGVAFKTIKLIKKPKL